MITIDEDVFGWNEQFQSSNETFVVAGEFERSAVLRGLERAAHRFVTIDQDGYEHPDMEAAAAAGRFTPSYVSDPEPTERGIQVYVDAKGGIDPPMADALRRVLREELERVATDAHVSVAP
jgi:hypothetical protein